MRYRHPNGARLALTTGHVAKVGPEWKALDPMFHAAALTARCEVDQGVIPAIADVPPPAPSPQAVAPVDSASVIRRTLEKMIERNGKDDFTGTNLPNIKTLEKMAGIQVNKGEVYAIYRDMQAEAAAPDAEA